MNSPATPLRERLIQAAIAVFAERGYNGTTVDDIVAAAGSSKGAFYFYFPNKEGLFLAIVEDFATSLASAIAGAVSQASGALAKVEAAIEAGVRAFGRDRALSKIMLVEAVGLNPAFENKRREIYARFAALIQSYLDRAVAEKDIPAMDTEMMAYAWLGAINEVVVHWLETGRPTELEKVVPDLARFIINGLRG